jgi:hypothetical protein
MHINITRTKSIVAEEVVRKYCCATTSLYYEHIGKGKSEAHISGILYRTEQAFRRVKHDAQISDLIHRSEQGTVVTYQCSVHSRIQCCSLYE